MASAKRRIGYGAITASKTDAGSAALLSLRGTVPSPLGPFYSPQPNLAGRKVAARARRITLPAWCRKRAGDAFNNRARTCRMVTGLTKRRMGG